MVFDFKISSLKDYQCFIDYLKSVSKNETVEDHERHIKILNTKQKVIAISMSNIRNIAKKIYKNGYKAFLEIGLDKSYQDEFYEETLIQGLVIAEIKNFDEQIVYLKKWLPKIDNWSTCDSVVSTLKTLKKSQNKADYFKFYYGLCFEKQEFVSRFGIVVLMTCYLEEEFIDKILLMCEQLKSEDYYINMALAWLLSFAFMKFKTKTYKLLERRILSKFVQNKTISKCRDSFQIEKQDKEKLVEFRIK